MFIIFLHCLNPLGMSNEAKAEFLLLFMRALFGASSGIFAFISGYLFYHLEHEKLSLCVPYLRFFWVRKICNLFFPMICTSFIILGICIYGFNLNFSGWFTAIPLKPVPDDMINLIMYISLGGGQSVFWYIPFCLLCFFISPFIIKLDNKTFILISSILFIIPFFTGRITNGFYYYTWNGHIAFLRLFLYHFPFFIFGMLFSKYKTIIVPHFKYNFISLVISFFILEMIIFVLLVWFPKFRYFDNIVHSFIYLKTLIFIPILYIALEKINNRNFILDTIASYSFCLYFFHCFVLQVYIVLSGPLINKFTHHNSFLCVLTSVLLIVITILTIIAIGYIIKRIFGKYSRWIIGA